MEQENKPDLYKGNIKDIRNTFKIGDSFVLSKTFRPIFKKTEKLTTAIYLLTDYLDERESFRWEIREKAICLLSYMGPALSSGNTTSDVLVYTNARNTIGEILVLLELAFRIGFISQMNYSILKEEYMSLHAMLANGISQRKSTHDTIFPDNFFAVEAPEINEKTPNTGLDNKRHNKGHEDKGHKEVSFTDFKNQNTIRKQDKNVRRESILSLIKTKGEVSIKDISSIITDCSEKTIQRELMSLMGLGAIVRRGERRWSTYVLKEPLATMH